MAATAASDGDTSSHTASVRWFLPPAMAGGAIVAGLVSGSLVVSGHGAAVLGLAAIVLPVAVWKRPSLGPVVLVLAAVSIEQFPYRVGARAGTPTARIPLFKGLGPSAHVSLADVLLLVLLLIMVLKGDDEGVRRWPHSAVTAGIVGLLVAATVGVAVGVAHHGDLRTSLMEVRPYVYLAAAYLLTAVVISSHAGIRAVLWAFVLGSGFKAAQGLVIFAWARHLQPRPEAVLAHEEAFFFGLFVFITLGLWLFEIGGRLRATATMLLPIVVVADLVNSRRTAWLILFAGLTVLLVLGFVSLPHRRRFLGRLLGVGAVFLVLYLPAYWNKTGSLGQPARAIHGYVSPDPRDAASNLYRVQENANLKLNIRQARLIGKGFGVRIDYALPIVDLSRTDPLIAYIPHNGVLYLIMRMGIVGGVAFWYLIAAGTITASRSARSHDREVALTGALIVCALVAYLLQGYNDQGFFFYRIALAVGCLLGLGEAALRLRTVPTPRALAPERATAAIATVGP